MSAIVSLDAVTVFLCVCVGVKKGDQNKPFQKRFRLNNY